MAIPFFAVPNERKKSHDKGMNCYFVRALLAISNGNKIGKKRNNVIWRGAKAATRCCW